MDYTSRQYTAPSQKIAIHQLCKVKHNQKFESSADIKSRQGSKNFFCYQLTMAKTELLYPKNAGS